MSNPKFEQLVKDGADVHSTQDQLLNAPYGQQGVTLITDLEAHGGEWYCIVAIEDGTTLGASGTMLCNWDLNGVGGQNPQAPLLHANLPLPTGVPLYGYFTQLQLSVGKIVAYKR